jgi:hypothetical protein
MPERSVGDYTWMQLYRDELLKYAGVVEPKLGRAQKHASYSYYFYGTDSYGMPARSAANRRLLEQATCHYIMRLQLRATVRYEVTRLFPHCPDRTRSTRTTYGSTVLPPSFSLLPGQDYRSLWC